jgi:hypothetical protein
MPKGFGYVPYASSQGYDYAPGSRISEIILRAGEAAARMQQDQAHLLGSSVAGIGQQVGDIVAQENERKALAARDQRIFDLMGNDDASVEDFVRAAGPDAGLKLYQGVAAARKLGQVDRKEAIGLLPVALRGYKTLTPEGRAVAYGPLRQQVAQSGLIPAEAMPEEYTPEVDAQVDELLTALEPPKPAEAFSLGPNEVRFGPGGEEIARGITPEKVDTRSLDARYAEAVANGDQATAQQLLRAKAQLEAAGRVSGPKEPKLVQVETVDEQGRPVTKFVEPSAGASFAKPSGQAKPATGQQRKALNFFNRMKEADDVAMQLEQGGDVDPTKIKYTPELANFMLDDTNQAYKQAQRAFTESRLRKESGATIKDSEYEADARTYFKQPGDSAATLEQKRRMRQAVKAGIAFESGDALQEFYGPEAQGMIQQLQEASRSEAPAARQAVISDPNWGQK